MDMNEITQTLISEQVLQMQIRDLRKENEALRAVVGVARKFPKDDLWSLIDYVQADLHNGIQIAPGWDETLDTVRPWLDALAAALAALPKPATKDKP
jgi:hypothetical protein